MIWLIFNMNDHLKDKSYAVCFRALISWNVRNGNLFTIGPEYYFDMWKHSDKRIRLLG